MKKRLFAIVALILSLFVSVSAFAGCNLVSVNTEKDMAQIVATVQVSEDAPKEKIEKKQIMLAYMNYGYYYVQSGQYTSAQVIEMIMDNLVSTRIFIQSAIKEFDADANFTPKKDGVEKWNVERYLTDEQIIDAKYQVAKSFNDMVLGYIEEEETETKGDTSTETVRTVPTGATNAEDKLSDKQKSDYVNKYADTNGIDTGSTAEVKSAYSKVLKLLEQNGLLGNYNEEKNILETDYYKNSLKNAEESQLIKVYEDRTKASERAKVSFSALEQKYAEMYLAQQEGYDASESDYSSALSSATAAKPIVYNPYTGYGYVYNLLLGVSDQQTSDITDLQKDYAKTSAEYAQARKAIVDTTVVKDLRSTWITSGYDFDIDTKKFTGDYAFLSDSIPFQGEVTLLKEASEHNGHKHAAEYKISNVNEFTLSEFVDFMDTYVYGGVQSASTEVIGTVQQDSVYKIFNANGKNVDLTDFDDKMNELMFAFSTDPGSLNSYKGYTISPKPNTGDSETYMKEFAEAGRYVINMTPGSYVIVATDYGYHVMFYSQILNSTSYATLTEYLNSLNLGVSDWEAEYAKMVEQGEDYENTDWYLYELMNLCVNADTRLNEIRQQVITKYEFGKLSDGSKCVVKYTKTYQDLLK